MMFFLIPRQKSDELLTSFLSVFLSRADKNGYRFYNPFARAGFIRILFPVFQMIFQHHLKPLINCETVVAFIGLGTNNRIDLFDKFLFGCILDGVIENDICEILILIIGSAGKADVPGDLPVPVAM